MEKKQNGATKIYYDSKFTIEMVKNPVFHNKAKHINIKYHLIKEVKANKVVPSTTRQNRNWHISSLKHYHEQSLTYYEAKL